MRNLAVSLISPNTAPERKKKVALISANAFKHAPAFILIQPQKPNFPQTIICNDKKMERIK